MRADVSALEDRWDEMVRWQDTDSGRAGGICKGWGGGETMPRSDRFPPPGSRRAFSR